MFPELHQVLEALLFAADRPLTADEIAEVMHTATGDDPPTTEAIDAGIDALNQLYEETGRVFRVNRWAGGYQVATEPIVAPYLKALFADRGTRRLSRSLIETLSVAAYRQPVAKPEIDFVRGVDSGYALKRLLEMELLAVVGRSETVGKPLLYGTTTHFLERFGLNNLEELPKLKEIEELLQDPELRQRKELLDLQAVLGSEPADPADSTESTSDELAEAP
ncbi:MAG: SMC-Scp complex subunit ScpB [Bacteroidota bacterium]